MSLKNAFQKTEFATGVWMAVAILLAAMTVPAVAQSSPLAIYADSYVEDGSASGTNFGALPNNTLQVKYDGGTSLDRRAFVKFNVSGLPALSSVKLRLHGSWIANNYVQLWQVNDDTWTQTGLLWSNQPATYNSSHGEGSTYVTQTMVGSATNWYEWDITAWVQNAMAAGQTIFTFALETTYNSTDSPATFDSTLANVASNVPQVAYTEAVTATLGVTPSAPVVGTNVTMTATISSPSATGTVNFMDGSTLLGSGTVSSGVATYSTTGLAAGVHHVTGYYLGDSNFGAATSETDAVSIGDFIVNASPQSVTIAQGTNQYADISITPLYGFTGSVTVVPTTVNGVSGTSVTVWPGTVALMELSATSTATAQIESMTMTGTSSTGARHTAQTLLTVNAVSGGVTTNTPDYSFTSSNAALSLAPTSTQTATQTMILSAAAVGAYTGTSVNVSASELGTGLTPSFPDTTTLTLGSPGIRFTVTADSTAAPGNSTIVFTSTSTDGTITHKTPVVLNVGSTWASQGIVLGTPATMALTTGNTVHLEMQVYGTGGFDGPVTLTVSGLPSGVTLGVPANNPYTVYTNQAKGHTWTYATLDIGTVTAGQYTITVTATATSGTGVPLSQTNKVYVTLLPAAGSMAAATITTTVDPSTTQTFNADFIGFSFSRGSLEELAVLSGGATNPSFLNMLSSLHPYVSTVAMRVALPNNATDRGLLEPLQSGLTGIGITPKFFIGSSDGLGFSSETPYLTDEISDLGSSNITGFELGNEPDIYNTNSTGSRPMTYTFADYLPEIAATQSAFSSYIGASQLIVTAQAGSTWDVGLPALLSQEVPTGGTDPISLYTSHEYALSNCGGTAPMISTLMDDMYSHEYNSRYAALVKEMSPSIPVRVGEMNSVACLGYHTVSDTFASALWFVDASFEAKMAGSVGVNLHSSGSAAGSYYDIANYSSGSGLTVNPVYYGVLFLAQAIQNNAKTLKVQYDQSSYSVSGNIKIWAVRDDVAHVIRVLVLEKDTDGFSNSRNIALTLGTTADATLSKLTAGALTNLTTMNIDGKTFAGTTNGTMTTGTTPETIHSTSGVYNIVVHDGEGAMLIVPIS